MALRGPEEPAARAEWTRLRRRAAATHHPDLGGDTEAYLLALADIDTAFGVAADHAEVGGASSATSRPAVRRTWRGSRMRVARRGRRLVRTWRQHLPRSFPGAEHRSEI